MFYVNKKTSDIVYFDSRNMFIDMPNGYSGDFDTENYFLTSLKSIPSGDVKISVNDKQLIISNDILTERSMISTDTLAMVLGRLPRNWEFVGVISEDIDKMLRGWQNVQVRGDNIVSIHDAMVMQWFVNIQMETPVQLKKWLGNLAGNWYISGHWLRVDRNDGSSIIIYTIDYDKRVERIDGLFMNTKPFHDLDVAIEPVKKYKFVKYWYLGVKKHDEDLMATKLFGYQEGNEVEVNLAHEEPELWFFANTMVFSFLLNANEHINGPAFHTKLPNGVRAIGFMSDRGRCITTVSEVDRVPRMKI